MTNANFSRRSILKAGAGLAGALAMPAIIGSRGLAQSGTRDLNMQLGWLANGNQLGEIVAKQMGFFEEEGLNFMLQPGGPNIDGLAIVASGRFEMGVMPSSPSIMLATSQGIPVKCFGVGLQEHPYTFYSLQKAPVREPKDLIGKRVGMPATSKVLISALLKRHGIPESEVDIQIKGSDLTPLVTDQVDVITAWETNTTSLRVLGPDVIRMRLWDVGVKLYANNYYAPTELLEAEPELFAKFLAAAGRGWAYANEDPARAADLLVKELPTLNHDDEVEAAKVTLAAAFNAETAEHGWGYFSRKQWQDQITLYDELGQFSAGAPDVNDVVTEAIIEATAADRPKIG